MILFCFFSSWNSLQLGKIYKFRKNTWFEPRHFAFNVRYSKYQCTTPRLSQVKWSCFGIIKVLDIKPLVPLFSSSMPIVQPIIIYFVLLQVPAFESADGLCLTESNAIAYYLANEELRGGSCIINKVLDSFIWHNRTIIWITVGSEIRTSLDLEWLKRH